MIELVRHQHARRLRSTVVWGVSLGLLGLLEIGVFSTLDVNAFRQAIENYPQSLLDAFQIDPEEFTTPAGFVSGELLSFMVPLAIAFYPILGAARAMAGAEQNRSLDVILSQPVARWKLPAATFAAFTIGLLEIALLFCFITWGSAVAFGVDLDLGDALAGSLNLLPLAMVYGALALIVSAVARQSGLVTGIAGGALVLGYLLDTVGRISQDVDFLAEITPFRFYGTAILDGLDGGDVTVLVAGALLLLAVAMPLFRLHDVRA
jgi:ABC-2 type transport system permease protein